MKKTTIAGLGLALTAGMVAVPATAQAYPITPVYSIKNAGSSYTGAIYHRVRDGWLVGPAVVMEPGQDRRWVTFRADTTHKPYGIKVWQPAGSCLKVYRSGWFGFRRAFKYYPVNWGQDVWVTQGSSSGKTLVKIQPGYQCW